MRVVRSLEAVSVPRALLALALSAAMVGCGAPAPRGVSGADAGNPTRDAAIVKDGGSQDVYADAQPDSPLAHDAMADSHAPDAMVDDYPHLASVLQSGSVQNTYDGTFQAWASRIHLVILGGNWEGWEQGAGRTKEQVITGIKTPSTIHSRVYQYVNLNESPFPCGNAHGLSPCSASWFPTYQAKVDAMNWWTYLVGTSGSPANSTFNDAWGVIDMTSASTVDSATGLGPYGWGAMYANKYFHQGCSDDPTWCPGTPSSPAPSLDGFYLDNVFVQPRAAADWLRNGTTQSTSDAAAGLAVRTGEVSFFEEMEKLFPGTHFGNSDDFNSPVSVTPFSGAMGAVEYQSPTGYSFAVETWGGPTLMQTDYAYQYSLLAAPRYLIWASAFNPDGSDGITYDSSGNAATSSPAYQGLRHTLAACLMGDGYLEANGESGSENWFDEFDGGGLGVGYLGQPSSGATGAWQTAAWQNKVYKREFQNGIVLWNPRGNGEETVSLAGLGTLKHLKGTQAPTVNDGSDVTNGTVTLGDRDGLILLR
jgi:hypothetical protein